MKVYERLEEMKGRLPGCVLAIGNFDGIHLGHQEVFAAARRRAEDSGATPALLTFSRHPATVVNSGEAPSIIMTLEDRLRLAAGHGIEAALVLSFTDRLAFLSPEQFVDRILVRGLGVSAVVAGQGWKFGRGRAGDMPLLARLGEERGFSVTGVPPVTVGGWPVSSTRIRQALSQGDVGLATRLLGRPPFVRGTVQRGEGRGRPLGFPTVNLDCGPVMLPSRGVYAAAYLVEDMRGAAAVNIGVRPTFGAGPECVEAHLAGADEDLYGREVLLVFLGRLREELPFPDKATLRQQIGRDVARAGELYDPRVLEEVAR